MKSRRPCPYCSLPNSDSNQAPASSLTIRKGTYFRKCDSRYITRYFCKRCSKNFSAMTGKDSAHQKKRRVTYLLWKLMSSGLTQRQYARALGINRKTVARRCAYLGQFEKAHHQNWIADTYKPKSIRYIQFDDLETSEHTKCKPLSVAIAVDPETRKILSFKVNQMPAKGLLAKVALRKYGYRKDERAKGWNQMMTELKPYVGENAIFKSDSNPHYPKHLFKHFPTAIHETTIGGRGAVTGQGELKKLTYDPIFALNHTCAMLRAHISRLFRRTWNTTKHRQGLIDHLWIYVGYHNRMLTR